MSPFLAMLAFQAATVDPAVDPAFAKPVTLRMPLGTVREFVAAIAKATGQAVDASGTVNDWKATILVKDLPAGRTMEAVADTLGLVWKKDGTYLRLSRPDGQVATENAYLQAEAKLVQEDPARAVANPTLSDGGPRIQIHRGPGRRGGGGGEPMAAASRFDQNLLAMETANGQPPSRLSVSAPLGDSEYAKAIRAWPVIPQDVDKAWGTPVPAAMPLAKSTWENGAFTLGEILAAWHDVSHLPVVADAFRISMRGNMVNTGPALNSLQSYAASENVALKLSNGVARLRHPAFWRLRGQEIPEATWNTIERGKPTLDGLAAFAARLTVPQAAAFRSMEAPVSHVTTQSLREAYPALLLWNGLSTQVRKALYAGTPVGLSAVRNVSNTYAYALREAPYYNAGNPARVLAINPAQLGLFGTSTDKSFELRLSSEREPGVSYVISLP